MKTIYLDESQKKIILQILQKHFRDGEYYVFGSRATGKNLKPFSDVDIGVRLSREISSSQLGLALEEFSASDLPFKVDLVDLRSISKEFYNNIEKDFVQLG